MSIRVGLLVAALALCAAPAFADETAPAAPAPGSDEEIVCKIEKPATGSRTNFHRVCKTRAQWEADADMTSLRNNPALTVHSQSAMPSGTHN